MDTTELLQIANERIRVLEFALTEIMAISDNVDVHNIISSVLEFQSDDGREDG